MIFCAAGIAACAAAYIFSRLEFEHECQIDFLYEDRLVWNAQTRNDEVAKSADEHNRNAVQESLFHDFAKGMSPIDSLEQRVCCCREDAALASLRSAIDVVEQKMRATRWGRIRNRSQPRLRYRVLMKSFIGS